MTVKELSQLYYLKKEINMQRQILSELEAAATGSTARITGLPHSKDVSDRVGKCAAQTADLKCLLDLNLKKSFFELNRLTEYIQSVNDSLVRQIMTYRYIYGFNWQKTAFSTGGNNNPYNLKMRLYRYLKNRQLKTSE